MGIIFKILVQVLLLGFVIYVIYSTRPAKEAFTTPDITDIEQKIIAVYKEVLQRTPTSRELLTQTRQIAAGTLRIPHIRQRLIDSDEYQRTTRMQNNELIPELPKALTDKRTLKHISDMYKSVYGVKTPPRFALPLKDIYIMMDYNDTAFIKMLRNAQYPIFEEELLLIKDLKKDKLITVYKQYFGDSALTNMEENEARLAFTRAGNAVPLSDDLILSQRARDDLALDESRIDSSSLTWPALKKVGTVGRSGAGGDSVGAGGEKCLSDLEIRRMMEQLLQRSQTGKGGPIRESTASVPQERIHLHTDDMVLRPEFSWSVPGYKPPVCTTLGEKPLTVAPLLNSSTLLLGTPLGDARKTEVGSIMPKFTYDQYVERDAKK